MKKFLALLISLAMVVGLVAIPAAADNEVVIAASTVDNVVPGDTVEIFVSITGDYQAHAIALNLYYDDSSLSVAGTTWDAENVLLNEAVSMKLVDTTAVAGRIALSLMAADAPITFNGNIIKINFTVKDSCTTDQVIRVEVDQLMYSPIGGDPVDIPATTQNGAINLDPSYQPPEPQGNVFTVESKTVTPGTDVTVDFTLTGEEYAANVLDAILEYDTAVLTAKSATVGSVISGADESYVDIATPGKIKIAAVSNEAMTAYGVVATITFAVADDFEGTTTIHPTIRQFAVVPAGEYEGTPVENTAVDGILTSDGTVPPTPEKVVFTMESKENVAPGSTITLSFTVAGEYEAHILGAYLNYDAEVLEYVSYEIGDVFAGAGENDIVNVQNVDGSVRIAAIYGEDAFDGEGVIVKVTFKVSEKFDEATVIEVVINEFGYMPVGATIAEPIDYEAINGTVTPAVGPQPPVTGLASLVGLGVVAIATGAGVVIFRKKED